MEIIILLIPIILFCIPLVFCLSDKDTREELLNLLNFKKGVKFE